MPASDDHPDSVIDGLKGELASLIEEGYALFEAPRPPAHGCCENCCMYAQVEARLLDWPVRAIPEDDLRDWYFAASDNPFPRAVMKWFLPRVLHLVAEGRELASVGHEVVLRRLHDSGFPQEWPEAVVDFMTRYATVLMLITVHCPKTFDDSPADRPADHPADRPVMDEMLCMLGQGGVDLVPVLAQLDALPIETLAAAFSRDWSLNRREIVVNAFWESGPAKDLVYGWYSSESLLTRMLEYGCGDTGDYRGAALDFADAILHWREWTETST